MERPSPPAIIDIELDETASYEAAPAFSLRRWPLRLRCASLHIDEVVVVTDPFDSIQYKRCADYLVNNFTQGLRSLVKAGLRQYRASLSHDLGLRNRNFGGRQLHFNIHGTAGNARTMSFHRLKWELLEDTKYWRDELGAEIAFVTVRRVIASKSLHQGPLAVAQKVLDILLVIARKHIFEPEEDKPRPYGILSILLDLQQKLDNGNYLHGVRLEVVRPGCFGELQQHLEARQTTSRKPYDIVHFDMHGGIRYDGAGVLQTTPQPAADVATQLAKNGVQCAILSACRTAYAGGGATANLSESFISRGIPNVLAMSYEILDSAVEKFFESFYERFILQRKEFSESASWARQVLYTKPNRVDYSDQGPELRIEDWFVPIVYSAGRHLRADYCDRAHRLAVAWLQKPVPLSIKMRSTILPSITIWLLFWLACPVTEDLRTSISRISRLPKMGFELSCLATLSLCAIYYVRSNSHHDERYIEALGKQSHDRKNMLRIEGILKSPRHKRRMFFYHRRGDIKKGLKPCLDVLIDTWKRTNLIDRVYTIKADWFIQFPGLEDTGEGSDSIGNILSKWMRFLSRCVFLEVKGFILQITSGPRMVVVIENVNVLYPSDGKSGDHYDIAQENFNNWLVRHLDLSDGSASPFLILVGRTLEIVSSGWFEQNLPKVRLLGSIKALEYKLPSLKKAHQVETSQVKLNLEGQHRRRDAQPSILSQILR